MPAIDDTNTQIALNRLVTPLEPERDVGFTEAFAAGFRQDTMLGAYMVQESGLPDQVAQNESFNPVDHFTEYEKVDDLFIRRAAMADTLHELEATRRQYRKELDDRRTLEAAGAMGVVASIGAQFLDPINFIPVGGMTYKTYKLGSNILKGAAVTGSVAAGTTAVQEAALHNIQLTRTLGESATNVTGAALLGGVLGGGVAGISTALKKAGRNMDGVGADITQSMDVEPKLRRGEPSVGTSEVVFDRIDVIYSSDLKIADQIEADTIGNLKSSLEQDLELRLPRGDRKRLNAERRQLVEMQNAVKPIPEAVPTRPDLSARRAKQLAGRQAEARAESERAAFQERINEIDAELEQSAIGERAQSDLTRLEQGIIPDRFKDTIAMRKEQLARVEEILTTEEFATIRAEVLDEVDATGTTQLTPEDEALAQKALGEDSAGAMSVFNAPELRGKWTKAILRKLAWDPLSRTALSRNPVTRAIAADLAENPLAFEAGHVANALETRIKTRADGMGMAALEFANDQIRLYRQATPDNPMSATEFFEEVAKAFRRNDEHPNEFVQATAKNYRKEVYDPLKNDAQGVMGPDNRPLLGEDLDVKTALSYLNRKFRGDKIIENLPAWNRKVGKWLKDEDIRLRTEKGEDLDDLRTDAEYRDLAQEIGMRIDAEPGGVLPYDYKIGENSGKGKAAPVRGPLQKRKFLIPDELVEEFLENDMRNLAENYTHNMVAQVEFSERFGSMDMTSQLKDVDKWWADEIKKAPENKRKQLRKLAKRERQDIKGMRDRISYQFKAVEDPNSLFSRAGRVALNLNYLRLGGGFVAASFSDVARIIAAEGMFNLVRHGMPQFIRRTKGFKMAAKEARTYGVGIDYLKGSARTQLMADVNNYVRGETAFERGLQWSADNFGRINLMDQWTTGMKQLHITTLQNRLIGELAQGKYDPNLAQLGISKADATNVASQLKKYGGDVDGMKIANTREWDNQELAQLWAQAMRKESDRVIIMPGQDKPLFMSTQLGSVLLQFKSFMYSATQRILISSIQGRDAHVLQGTLAMLSMGMMSYAFKEWDAGRELSDDPRDWIDEGIDRSGMLGFVGELENTFEKMSGGSVGIRPLMGVDSQSSRYAARSTYETMAGPTFGSLINTALLLGNAASGDEAWAESDTRAFRRLLPYQNLSVLRQGVDVVEEEFNSLILD